MSHRVALYLRVSTVRQADKDLSIPDQRRQAEAYCAANGWEIVEEFVEPGASATDDRRPSFQRMIDSACCGDASFDVILVHSFSRFFRDAMQLEFYARKLAKHAVQLVSITQKTGDDPTSQMIRQIMGIFDEYQSKENAKHTLRAMKENARQGFWNGSRPPFGYRVVAVEQRGDRLKKRLEVDPAEAEMVRRIFTLYRQGEGRTGPLGVKNVVSYLNDKGFRQRNGARFSTKVVHEILTRTAYVGRHYFNQFDSRSKQAKPQSEWIEVEVPCLLEQGVFDEVQALLASRNPKKNPPRVVSGPTLLIGLAKCASCGGGMTIRTGKSGKYRYYACSTCARQGKSACKGRSVPMDRLDALVVDSLSQSLFDPARMKELLSGLIQRVGSTQDRRQDQLKDLTKELRDIDQRINRLYEAVESGMLTDADTLRNRMSNLQQRREEVMRLIAMTRRQLDAPRNIITSKKIDAFASAMRDRLSNGPVEFRKAYVRLFVERIEVDDNEVRISGAKAALSKALAEQDQLRPGMVPTFVQDWRPQGDSNPCRRRERAVS